MPDCEICGQPLGPGASEGVCRSCVVAGGAWAHRHLVRLWNLGLDRTEIANELGYTPESVTTLVLRLRNRGAGVSPRHARGRAPAPLAVSAVAP